MFAVRILTPGYAVMFLSFHKSEGGAKRELRRVRKASTPSRLQTAPGVWIDRVSNFDIQVL
jgi:hypothetical protein